jgi:acetyl esterase/lipase
MPPAIAIEPRTVPYGPAPQQFGTWWAGPDAPVDRPVVVLVHGGYWRNRYGLDLMDGLAGDLAGRGWRVWNLEFRRTGDPGGGWPGTFDDVLAGIGHVAAVGGRGPDGRRTPVVLVGHSAGGHLALWAAGQRRTVEDTPIVAAVGLGALTDLRAASSDGLSEGAADLLLGGTPAEIGDRFDLASPTAHPPLAPTLLVRGARDHVVPADQADRLVAAAAAVGRPVDLLDTADDHFTLIDPARPGWTAARTWLERSVHPGDVPDPAPPNLKGS